MMYSVILLGFLGGGVSVVSKALNYQAGNYLGTFNGSLINYLLATPISLVILLAIEGGKLPVEGFLSAPWWAYLGGICGVAAMVINVYSLRRITLFQSTTLLLVSQLVTSVMVDLIFFGKMSLLKALGVLLLGTAAGVLELIYLVWASRALRFWHGAQAAEEMNEEGDLQ